MKVIFMITAALLQCIAAKALLGGEEAITIAPDDEKIAFASAAINDYFLSKNENDTDHAVLQVLSATKQVVSGFLYRFKIKLTGSPNNQICDIQVLSQPWVTPNYQSKEIHCEDEHLLGGDDHDLKPHGQGKNIIGGDDHDYKPHGKNIIGGDDHDYKPHGKTLLGGDDHDYQSHKGPLGGEKLVEMSNELVQQALSKVIDRVNMEANHMYRLLPYGGTVTQQVVNGIIFRFKEVNLRQTTCRNNSNNKTKFLFTQCPMDENANHPMGRVNAKVYWDRETFDVQELDILE